MSTRIERVREVLNNAVGDGMPGHGGKHRFWNLPVEQLKTLTIYGLKVIETEGNDKGARSNLIKAIKGEPPFDESGFRRMPLDRDPVAGADIQFIQQWIDDGCPETDE